MSEHGSRPTAPRHGSKRPVWPWIVGALALVVAVVVAVTAVLGSAGTHTTTSSASGGVSGASSSGSGSVTAAGSAGPTTRSGSAVGTGGAVGTGRATGSESAAGQGTGTARATGTRGATAGSSAAATSSSAASPSGTERQLPPAAPDAVVSASGGLRFALTKVEAVDGKAVMPGEIAGPSVRVTVTVTNGGGRPVDLDLFAVNAYVGKDAVPARTVVEPGGRPFSGTLATGRTASGIYLFTIPRDQRDQVRVTVNYLSQQPDVVFEGSLAR
ncbi:hypothetical protein V6N00_11245 [Tersicoccus sp. MR15.9]|uniref:hypothetical protein n=1 Tax=Tersicoccus mangrovi TaxID=3121635 RepID=UPI002FE50187